jgi:hypothetical protein
MPTTPPRKSDLFGGIVLCAFPATILFAMYIGGARLPMPWPIFFAIVFVYGIRLVVTSLSILDLESPASWVADAVGAAGLAFIAFWFAWNETDGWDAGLPILPDSWNQNLARVLFACGGLIAALFAVRCLLKAFNQYRNKPDAGMWHE